MPSRKQRKRYRRQLAEATANCSQMPGGRGAFAPTTRGDLLLLRQAICEGWPVPQIAREAIVGDLMALVNDPATRPRMLIAMAWAFLEMDRANARR